MGCVYQAENTVNGKLYIGKTVLPLIRRITIHKKGGFDNAGKMS